MMESNSCRRKTQHDSVFTKAKKGCLSFSISFQENIAYCKAFVVGQGKKLLARNEKEATAADLKTAKMKVEATDVAEYKKNRVRHST